MSGVHHLVLGPPEHGVTRLGAQLLDPADPQTPAPTLVEPADAARIAARLPPIGDAPALHLHLTDGLLGPDPGAALATIARGRRLALTLHDVPQPGEGEARLARRSALYRDLAQAADLVIVSSEHERAALTAMGGRADAVLPLPIDAREVAAAPEPEPTVGVLGFVYPGKGHEALLHLLASLDRPATLVALGGLSAGHDDLGPHLREVAGELGVGFRLTGYLAEPALLAAAATVRVPVCAHRHISASASVGTWMQAGRRPLVVDGGYAQELSRRLPDALWVETDLGLAIAAALDDPASTILPDRAAVGPTTPEAAQAQRTLLRRWAAGLRPEETT